MNTSRGVAIALLVVCVTSVAACSASASTIVYQDLFNDQQNINRGGSYTQSLGGSFPTTRVNYAGGSDTATWTFAAESGGWGQRDYNDDNVATPTSSNYLPFTPQQGFIYTLSSDITVNQDVGADWFTIGFVSAPSNWVVSGAFTVNDYNSVTEQGIVRWNSTNLGQTRRVTYTLDTTASNWTNTDNIGYVGWFTAGAGNVNLNSTNQVAIDNFTLTAQPVPEPGSLAGAGVGLLGAAMLAFRRRRAA